VLSEGIVVASSRLWKPILAAQAGKKETPNNSSLYMGSEYTLERGTPPVVPLIVANSQTQIPRNVRNVFLNVGPTSHQTSF